MAGYKYALPGPPFNFLGNFSQTQFGNLQSWVNARTSKLPAIQTHYQIRAQQLRKMAGALEQFTATVNDVGLTPKLPGTAFQKEAWQPGPMGQFNYAYRDDHLPMITVQALKSYMKPQFQRDDELWFFMNHIRTQIEKLEDAAQYANDAINSTSTNTSTANIKQLLSYIAAYFSQNRYQAVLVNDQSDTYGQGAAAGPRFRVHQMDAPTQWELERMNHSTPQTPIQIKESEDSLT